MLGQLPALCCMPVSAEDPAPDPAEPVSDPVFEPVAAEPAEPAEPVSDPAFEPGAEPLSEPDATIEVSEPCFGSSFFFLQAVTPTINDRASNDIAIRMTRML